MSLPKSFYNQLVKHGIHWLIMERWTQLQTNLHGQKELRKDLVKNYGFRKIIFVRHPFTRLVSAYRDKVLKHELWVKDILKFNSTASVS